MLTAGNLSAQGQGPFVALQRTPQITQLSQRNTAVAQAAGLVALTAGNPPKQGQSLSVALQRALQITMFIRPHPCIERLFCPAAKFVL